MESLLYILTIMGFAAIAIITGISLILLKKNKQNSKSFSRLTLLLSVLFFLIPLISGQIQQNEYHKYIDLTLEKHVTKEFVDKTFEKKLDQREDVIFKDNIFLVCLQMRSGQNTAWQKVMEVKPGDEIEFQLHYRNNGYGKADNVMMHISLPEGFTYINNSSILFNSAYPEGVHCNSNPTLEAINVGDYAVYGDAYLRFKVKVKDKNLKKGTYQYITWAKVSAKCEALQDNTQTFIKINYNN